MYPRDDRPRRPGPRPGYGFRQERERPERFPAPLPPEPSGPNRLDVAIRVISQSTKEKPADGQLREFLKSTPGLTREDAGRIAHLVFRYYRWKGLVSRHLALRAQIEAASDYAQRFAENPDSFTRERLLRTIPDWVTGHLEVSDAWLRAIQTEPTLWLRSRPGQRETLAAELGDCEAPNPVRLPDTLAYRGTQDLFRQPAFQKGSFELQDVASQIVGLLCAPDSKQTWWDACAGEGGKTLHLADLLGNQGTVWATDRASWRLDKLRRRAARAGLFNVRWAAWDGAAKLPMPKRMDGVLVDAPCSGLGTWQRNPQARWTTTPEDVAELAVIQARLLKHASAAVRPGGKLVYAVCTLTRAETVEVAAAFSAAHPEFVPLPMPSFSKSPAEAGEPEATHAWLRPEDLGGNGMFIATWRRQDRLPTASPTPEPPPLPA